MRNVSFIKMQAQGNDFVILDGRFGPLPDMEEAFIRTLADRRLGVGCDQVLVLLPDNHADCAVRIFNSDGSEAENCGNGLRCIANLLLEDSSVTSVLISLNGRTAQAERSAAGICVYMGKAIVTGRTPVHVDVDMGNPHRVFFEATESFPDDRNIEIISGRIADGVYVDIIERGSGHTPACGSGACAVTAAIWAVEGHTRPQTIHMPGGDVVVSGNPDSIRLEGPVSLVFTGKYNAS